MEKHAWSGSSAFHDDLYGEENERRKLFYP
jgi:hypothetical protein